MTIAEILVFRGVPTPYTYEVPENMANDITPGVHVEIPFGKSTTSGLVLNLKQKDTINPILLPKSIKAILSTDSKRPTLPKQIIDLINWFQTTYQTTPHKAYQTIVGTKKIRQVESAGNTPIANPTPHTLTPDQTHVIKTILAQTGYSQFLIHGVTASGKTEVYMQLAQSVIEDGKDALILVPEIALTPQFTQVFEDRFGQNIAVMHSGLTPKQKEVAWNKILTGSVKIAIGPRSAIFSPFANLGLVIIDEEHEPSYKQDTHPRYQTHTIARYICKESQSKLVLGSATPDIQTYWPTQISDATEKFTLLSMKTRVQNKPLPTVQIVDMKDEIQNQNFGPFSTALIDAITSRLEKKEKTLILLNRRGYSPLIICQSCGTIHTCDHCNLSFTYHRDKRLRCHRCQITAPLTHTCAKCNRPKLTFSGLGTQKAETELIKLFPKAHVLRLDRDSAKTHHQLNKILTTFKQEGDIIIGTQMLAKGHDIDTVTLVGILGIDTTLNLPDYLAPERTFQLITQVAGRAGRGKIPGEVVLQTLQPDHYAITAGANHDFIAFYNQEVKFRQELNYPPFKKLIAIYLSSPNEKSLRTHAAQLGAYLKNRQKSISGTVEILGPQPAAIEKINQHYRWIILIKCDSEAYLQIKNLLTTPPVAPKDVRVIKDFEPKSLF